ncbi:SPOR domain-containing protein [Paenibacillus donghaensis]|uniref:SPOR domain-containing protein n=1 Tax=Paenibacillus donghaensis TaxID=414771 RepID=A0A2Z2KQW0_9BACL|nr:SPOR domain-containing protein [Paenibacillus donghaensis]ASA23772.1 hypothetical protein B9T62_25115 [Paenibacillus donghaensis]
MNNGRMTFRFNADKDKPVPAVLEHRRDSGLGSRDEQYSTNYNADLNTEYRTDQDEEYRAVSGTERSDVSWVGSNADWSRDHRAESRVDRSMEERWDQRTKASADRSAEDRADLRTEFIVDRNREDRWDQRTKSSGGNSEPPRMNWREPQQPKVRTSEGLDLHPVLLEPDAKPDVEDPPRAEYAYSRYSPMYAADDEIDEDWLSTGNQYLPQAGPGQTRGGWPAAGADGSYHTRRPSNIWKFAVSVTGALGIGLLLGYMVLSLFSGGNTDGGAGAAIAGTLAAVDPAAGTAEGGGEGAEAADPAGAGTSGLPLEETADPAAGRIGVQVGAQSYYLLQYGVFSTPAGAEQAKQELLAAGLAASLDPADGNRVYAGLSPDREQAKLLSSGLKNEGIELYVREVALPAAEQLRFGGTAATVSGYFAVSGELLSELSSQSAALLAGGPGTTDTAAVSDLHLQWSESVKALEQGLPAEAQAVCAELEKAVSRGISALTEYNKNKAQGLLWEVQEAMMSFLEGQKQLMAVMA